MFAQVNSPSYVFSCTVNYIFFSSFPGGLPDIPSTQRIEWTYKHRRAQNTVDFFLFLGLVSQAPQALHLRTSSTLDLYNMHYNNIGLHLVEWPVTVDTDPCQPVANSLPEMKV
eukprot:scaffold84348_cov19-Tisochrysis_lutea.AAC.4